MSISRFRPVLVAAAALVVFALASLIAADPANAATCPMAMSSRKYKVKIDSAPPGATVYLDRKECGAVGITPWAGTLAAGNYMVIVELDGYEAAQKPIKVARTRAQQETTLALVKKAEPPRIDVRADNDRNVFDAEISLDGQAQGRVPTRITPTQGRHHIEIRRSFEAIRA
ncbi:MAG: PEGA domain-containing protein [Kofleriaceae bacterium]